MLIEHLFAFLGLYYKLNRERIAPFHETIQNTLSPNSLFFPEYQPDTPASRTAVCGYLDRACPGGDGFSFNHDDQRRA